MSDVEAVRERLAQMRALCEAAITHHPLPWRYGDVDSVAGGTLYDRDVTLASVFYDGDKRVDPRIRPHRTAEDADAAGWFMQAASPDLMLRLVTEAEGVLDRHQRRTPTWEGDQLCGGCMNVSPCPEVEAVVRAWTP